MITEDYVSFETAKLLKDKGFNGVCRYYYPDSHTQLISYVDCKQSDMFGPEACIAPTLQMAMKWLREVHGVYIEIPIVGMEWESPTKWYYGWRCQTKDVIDRPRSKDADYPTYEQAVEAALKYSLENLI